MAEMQNMHRVADQSVSKNVQCHEYTREYDLNLTQKHMPKAIPTKDSALPRVSGVDTSDKMALQTKYERVHKNTP